MPISSSLAVGSGTAGTVGDGGTPPEQSASRIVAKTATGSHTLTLDGYSRIKEESKYRDWEVWGNRWITSATFTAGGHIWSAEFLYERDEQGRGLILMLLRLRCTHCSDGERVQARYTFSILDRNGQPSYSASSGEVDTFTAANSIGVRRAIRCLFDESRATTYLSGDSLEFRCDVTVYKELRSEDHDVPTRLVAMPPANMGEQLGRLLSSSLGADLKVQVAGETFAVHRNILAVRSPVLLEEIVSGSVMKGTEAASRHISGVEARVFMALLHYIYTDSLPEIDEDETTDMARHLIAAANRYSLDRLKLICEDKLCRRVDS